MPAKKQITKEKILAAAFELLRREGLEAVTIKGVAKELHCSTQPVYLSFDGMDDLRNQLIPMALEQFTDFMKKESKDESVRLYGMDYIQFAKKEPKLFYFLFMRSHAFEETKEMLLPMIEEAAGELAEDYRINMEEADRLHDHLWMHTHGIAAMIATDFCDWNMEKVGRMLAECRRAFTREYEA